MNNTMTGKQFLDTLAGSLTTLFASLMEQVFGPGVHTRRFGSVTWADLGVLVCLVLLVLLVNGLAASFLRRKIRQAEAHPEAKQWSPQLWRTVGWPLDLLISRKSRSPTSWCASGTTVAWWCR